MTHSIPTCFLWIVAFFVFPIAAWPQTEPQDVETPAPVRDVLYLRPFVLETGYPLTWVPDRPTVDRGVIAVLSVDPALVVPRNSAQPVLYAGDRVVERLNWGNLSGRVIVVIPGDFDVTATPLWFGSPGLPGRVPRQEVLAELAAVERTAKKPSAFRAEAITQPEIRVGHFAELLRGELAELVLRFSPQESHLADKWRLPEARAPQNPAVVIRPEVEGSAGAEP
ncbi:MAG: hypothetical protein AAGM22_31065 [Acidobacteriota bacterium]